mmetsp:Transcript_24964/g.37330  ORF Transcript_24964/g.37330 Transcript_24964/m.37330 type:complete len:798 (+) Transcript_24964:68-2461(+)
MSDGEDEWAVFGSDSDCSSNNDPNDDDDDNDNNDEDDDEEDRIDEISRKEEEQAGQQSNSSTLMFFEKAIGEICLFITKEFITSSRSIPLNLRYVSAPFSTASFCPENNEFEHSSDKNKKLWWNESFLAKIRQRGIQIVEPPLTTSSLNQKKYLSDAGNLFGVFERREDSDAASDAYEQTKQDQLEQSYESILRRTIAPGGFLLLTMYMRSSLDSCTKGGGIESINTSASASTTCTDRTGKNPVYLISQWKNSNGQPIFSDSVWDIEHASIVTYKRSATIAKADSTIDTFKNQVEEIYSISLTKRPCTVNTLSCPWKTDLKLVPPSKIVNDQQGINEKQEQQSKLEQSVETWLQYERRILADATVPLSIAELHGDNQQTTNHVTTAIPSIAKEKIENAVKSIQKHGFVILPCLFSSHDDIHTIRAWSEAIMDDFHSACAILKSSEGHKVDILNPGEDDTFEPRSYREMAMREDLRVDLRDGPSIRKLRSYANRIDVKSLAELSFECLDDSRSSDDYCGTKPNIIDSKGDAATSTLTRNSEKPGENLDSTSNERIIQESKADLKSLRFNSSILEIVRKLLNPRDDDTNSKGGIPMYRGNFGRYNFDGRGPNGTPQSLRVGQVSSVISLPRAGDQAIHADTPHLFELYDCLPCHYANLFILGDDGTNISAPDQLGMLDEDGNFRGDNPVGGTAFVHGSHKLTVTARLTGGHEGEAPNYHSLSTAESNRQRAKDEMHMRIIRPSLVMGDALIFDTRVLHFGLANQSETKCRPMLYVNLTHSWFNDPKNWDDEQSIFEKKI